MARINGDVQEVDAGEFGTAVRLEGTGFLNIDHDPALNCNQAITLEAWIYPRDTQRVCNRIIDKSIAGTAQGYDLDLLGNALRLISNARAANPMSEVAVHTNQWIHVAATIDGETGALALYINGRNLPIR